MRRFVWLTWLVFGITHSPHAGKTADEWMSGFPVYPRAKYLCYQHVSGNTMHIFWKLFATPDSPEKVTAFFTAKFYSPGQNSIATFEKPSPREFIWQIGKEKTLHAMPKGNEHPSCGVNPPVSMKTVFVISRSTQVTEQSP